MNIASRLASSVAIVMLGALHALPAAALEPAANGAVESEYSFQIAIPGEGVKTSRGWVVGTLLSEPGQNQREFINAVAAYLNVWTAVTGNEACASIALNSPAAQWGVVIVTQRSQMSCVSGNQEQRPDAMVFTGQTIHSHPPVTDSKPMQITRQSAQQAKLLGRRNITRGAWLRTQDVEHFSPTDIAGGSGYLVTQGRLLYQCGTGTEMDMGAITSAMVASNR